MIRNYFLILALLASLFLASCERFHHDSGAFITEYRSIDTTSFNSISLSGQMDLLLNQEFHDGLKIEGGENIIPYIESEILADELQISEDSNNFLHDKTLRVSLVKHQFDAIDLFGSGDLNADEIVADHFSLTTSGSGDAQIAFEALNFLALVAEGSGNVVLIGDAESSSYIMKGSGDLKAKHLHLESCTVLMIGTGNAELYVDSVLNATILGSGDLRYWGNPTIVNVNMSGSGTVIHMQ